MIKYSILLVVFLASIPSVFAGTDTDTVCADDMLQGRIDRTISVQYLKEEIEVARVLKHMHSLGPMEGPIDPNKHYNLYYIVNVIHDSQYVGSELYSYNCNSKSAKRLLSLPIDHMSVDYYEVDYLNDTTLIVIGRVSGIAEGPTGIIIGYNIVTNRKIFTLKNTPTLFPEGTVSGFVSGSGAWYIYFEYSNYTSISSLFRIDKKTKKITKL